MRQSAAVQSSKKGALINLEATDDQGEGNILLSNPSEVLNQSEYNEARKGIGLEGGETPGK